MKSISRKKLKILIVVDTMTIGGTEKLTAMLANGFVDKGHDCSILALRSDLSAIRYVNKEKVSIYTAVPKYKCDLTYLLKVRKIVLAYRPDVILSQALYSFFSIKIATLFKTSIPVFLVLHYTYNVNFKDDLFDFIYFMLLRLTSDKIVTIYNDQMDLFTSRHKLPIHRFICIHNGIDTDYFGNNKRVANKDNKLLKIVHIANIRKEKDQMTLLKALEILDRNYKNWQLIFCGKDLLNSKGEFMKYLQSENLVAKVKFMDHVSDVRSLLYDADVFVLSSKSEALPVSALEAMSMGIPCVLTNVGGCSELIDDGVNGFLCNPGNPNEIADKLLFLSENPNGLRKMGNAAREKVLREFRIESTVKKYLKLFEEHLNT